MVFDVAAHQREDLVNRMSDNLAAVGFHCFGTTFSDTRRAALDIEARAFAAAEAASTDAPGVGAEHFRVYVKAAGAFLLHEARTRSEGGLGSGNVDGFSAAGPDGRSSGKVAEEDGRSNDDGSEESEVSEASEEEEEVSGLAALIRKLAVRAAEKKAADRPLPPLPSPALSSFDLGGVAELIASGKCQNIIVMAGAGISVSAGIPDFRTPGTGLYDNLQKYNLPHPTAVFELDYFRHNPRPFYLLAKELYPGQYPPTPTHHFVNLLHKKGLLLRCFTQNIDSLEAAAGLPPDRIVAAHGNFDSAHCLEGHEADVAEVRRHVDQGEPMSCHRCGALVKPDIVFFGENLPARFNHLVAEDFPSCDLLIVAGTSLAVHPFAGLINYPSDDTPRLLVNREVVGELDDRMARIARLVGHGSGFNFGEGNYRDALFLGDCDVGFKELARLLGWEDELEELIAAGMLGAKN